jgi:hypothetical protein
MRVICNFRPTVHEHYVSPFSFSYATFDCGPRTPSLMFDTYGHLVTSLRVAQVSKQHKVE